MRENLAARKYLRLQYTKSRKEMVSENWENGHGKVMVKSWKNISQSLF